MMCKKALIVDSEKNSRIELGSILAEFGFDVAHTVSGAEAVQVYEENPTFDLVFVCVEMPGINGFTTTKMIRQCQRAKKPYIIGLTAGTGQLEKAIKSGMDFLVLKSQVGCFRTSHVLGDIVQFPIRGKSNTITPKGE